MGYVDRAWGLDIRRDLVVFRNFVGLFFVAALLSLAPANLFGGQLDNFSGSQLDPDVWAFADPLADSSISLAGGVLTIQVPAPVSHNIWDLGNRAPRVMQPVTEDPNFRIEVKFNSLPSQKYQMQGLLVEQNVGDFFKFDIFSDGISTQLFVGDFIDGVPMTILNTPMMVGNPSYLAIQRESDIWNFYYSADGANWILVSSFSRSLSVTSVGIFASNHGNQESSPAFTAIVDYFLNTAQPEYLENSIAVQIMGNGQIALTPDLPSYQLGDEVSLLAIPDAGHHFVGWSGDLEGSSNPVNLTIAGLHRLTAMFDPDESDSVINIWYSEDKVFGQLGQPQPWLNIFGNVTSPNDIIFMGYAVNGSSQLPIDYRLENFRLANDGDFNIELPTRDLKTGLNYVRIYAKDFLGNEITQTIPVDYNGETVWPHSYSIDWSGVTELQDVAQVVDGDWGLEPNGVRSHSPHYDRLVAIGDLAWKDYEITVPVTFHQSFNHDEAKPGGRPGLGLLMRWRGHYLWEVGGSSSSLPRIGWWPMGALSWYRWTSPSGGDFSLWGNQGEILDSGPGFGALQPGATYIFKMRVESIADVGGLYQFKVWLEGETEPVDWLLSGQETLLDPQEGSLLLLAHHVDATFGNVVITPLNIVDPNAATLTTTVVGGGSVLQVPDQVIYQLGDTVELTAVADSGWVFDQWSGEVAGSTNPDQITMTTADHTVTATFLLIPDSIAPVISNIVIGPLLTTATVTWETDEPADSRVIYGQDSNYTLGDISDATLVMQHSVTLTGLVADQTYHCQITSADASANSISSSDQVFTTLPDPSGIVSDDFTGSTLDESIWTFVNPLSDASYSLVGGVISLIVPEGVSHDIWSSGKLAPRIMQSAADTDFRIEAKFNSLPNQKFQIQGLLVEQDAGNFIRFDIYYNGTNTQLFMADFVNDSPTPILNVPITMGVSSYLAVERVGDLWNFYHSDDGVAWSLATSFTRILSITSVGVFAANHGSPVSSSPAFTGVIDYFSNPVAPVPVDPNAVTLTVTTAGGGSVTQVPNQSTYQLGDTVELTAVPDSGWMFDQWSGDVTGSTNPTQLTTTADHTVTATFSLIPDSISPVISNITIQPFSTTATVTWETDEPADSRVIFGLDPNYTLGDISDVALVTQHSITLTGLSLEVTYHCQIISADVSTNTTFSSDEIFTTVTNSSGIVSDDFNDSVLDENIWTFVNPVGDANYSLSGGALSFEVPGGGSHDVWKAGNLAPRIMQSAMDTDFRIEAKFDSLPSQKYQVQGLLVEQDVDDLIRFDIYFDGENTRLFSADFVAGNPTIRLNAPIVIGIPSYFAVERMGDIWNFYHSEDGLVWSLATSFTRILSVTSVGVFAANHGVPVSVSPAYTGVVDYFSNAAVPPSDVIFSLLSHLSESWLQTGPSIAIDLNNDGIVNYHDLALIVP